MTLSLKWFHIWALAAAHALGAGCPGCRGRPRDPGVCRLPPDNGINVSPSQISPDAACCSASDRSASNIVPMIFAAQSAHERASPLDGEDSHSPNTRRNRTLSKRPRKTSMGNASVVRETCFSARRLANATAPRSFSRGSHLKPFAIDAH